MLLAAAAVLVGAATQSATGFGFALVAGPALFAVLEPGEAVAALAVLGIVLSVLVLADGSPGLVRRRALAPLLLAALPGLVLGVLLLDLLSKAVLQVGVGVAVLAAVLIQARSRPAAEGGTVASPAAGGAVGLVSGVLTTSIGVNGPPVVLWLEARGTPPDEFRATLAATFVAFNAGGLVALVAARGATEVIDAGRLLPLVALVLAGHVGGALAFRRLDARSFRVAVLVLVVAAGVASAIAGLVSL